jgi:copper(I)-binding protein
MRNFLRAAIAAICLAVFPASAFAHGVKIGDIDVGHPWSPVAAAGAPTIAGYLFLTNHGTTADTLIGVTTDQAESVSIHQSVMENGMMRMLAVKALEIAPGKTVTFSQGGYHLMLVKPKVALPLGGHFFVTLRFQHAGSVKADFVVQAPPVAAAAAHTH